MEIIHRHIEAFSFKPKGNSILWNQLTINVNNFKIEKKISLGSSEYDDTLYSHWYDKSGVIYNSSNNLIYS